MTAGVAAPPSARYAEGAARGDWSDDPAQRLALVELDRLHATLREPAPTTGLLKRLLGAPPPAPPQGLYLWGGVGRGKTFLIDLFYDGLPLAPLPPLGEDALGVAASGTAPSVIAPNPLGRKRRTHYHRFMREVHARLRAHAGASDPLAAIARDWRQQALRVLVLDEFFVNDIGDAMLLGRLLERLLAEGATLVTSSNAAPQELYKDGLQRARFLPAIALLERHCAVLHLDSPRDYRLRALTRSPVYRAPLDADSDAWLDARWRELGGEALGARGHRDAGIVIEGRRIPVRARCEGMAWFDFAALCEGPRAAADYIEIASEFHTVLVGGIPAFDGHAFEGRGDDPARRFVHLIDELYDRHVNLVCTAAAAPAALYPEHGRIVNAFARTASRLTEMQSAEYLAREHRG